MKFSEFQNAATTNAPPTAQEKNAPLDPKTRAGAAAVSRALGGKPNAKFAQAIDQAEKGKALNPSLLQSLAPFAGALEKIFADPALRTKFLAMVKLVKAVENVNEDQDSIDAVSSAVTRRIMMQHTDLLGKYGPVKVMAAINDVADFAGSDGLEEIGSSDVSIWTKQVIQDLEAGHYDRMESVEKIDELSKGTLGSYVKKASGAEKPKNVMSPKNVPLTNIAAYQGDSETGHFGSRFNQGTYDKAERLRKNRETGIKRAVDKLTKEEAEGDKPYICLYVKKDKVLRHECYAPTSYEAAKKAAGHWGLKSTAGVSAHLADDSKDVKEAEQLDEILPAIGAAVGRAVVGSGASAVTRSVAGGVGHVAGTVAQDALGDSDEDPTDADSENDEVDTVTLDVPLLLRMMEYAREDAQEDMDLHNAAERMIELSKNGALSMDDYDSIVGDVEALPAPDKVGEDSGKSKQYIEIVSLLGHTKRVPVHPLNAYKALNHYRDQPSTKSARIVSEDNVNEEYSMWKVEFPKQHAGKSVNAGSVHVKAQNTAHAHKVAAKRVGVDPAVFKTTVTKSSILPENYYSPGPETMPGAVGPQEDTNVSFNQTKRMGDASVTVSANAKDMEELHRVLKLAGIEVKGVADAEPSVADTAAALAPHMPAEEPCGCDDTEVAIPMVPGPKPLDLKYTTDKTALINAIKDKLAQRLS